MTDEEIQWICTRWCAVHNIQICEERHPLSKEICVSGLVSRSAFNAVVHYLKCREGEALESICKRMGEELGILDPMTAIRLMTETQKAPARNFPDEGPSPGE